MARFVKMLQPGNRRLLAESSLGSLFGMATGASVALMFALMTGRSLEKTLILVISGAAVFGGVMFVIVYLHYMGRDN
jgi:ABC-type cobalamin transport system permease subunit